MSPMEEEPTGVEVRQARLEDVPWVRDLAVRSVGHGIPATRRIPLAEVQAQARRHLSDLELTFQADPTFLVLVASDRATGQRLGYLMLDLAHREASTGEPQAMIHDLAVEPEHWGRGVAQALVGRAARIAHGHGLDSLVGEVTAGNRRPLVNALSMGFAVERYQISARCGPEGLLPLSGAPPVPPSPSGGLGTPP